MHQSNLYSSLSFYRFKTHNYSKVDFNFSQVLLTVESETVTCVLLINSVHVIKSTRQHVF